jgi:hypothetical protein
MRDRRALFSVVAAVLCLAILAPLAWLGYRRLLSRPARHRAPATTAGPYQLQDVLTERVDLERRLPALRQQGVALGNSPYEELVQDEVAINAKDEHGHLVPKPETRRRMGYLRTTLFNPFDPLSYFHDPRAALSDDTRAFLTRYRSREVLLTTNRHGERVTLPVVESPRTVLIAGDSVAFGPMLEDGETLASVLQAGDRERQYVNLGIIGGGFDDIRCALERAAVRHARIDSLIYVACENDLWDGAPYRDWLRWLASFKAGHDVGDITLVYAPYVYSAIADVSWVRGHDGFGWRTYEDERDGLLAAARAAGWETLDFGAIAREEQARTGSQYAAFALFVDHVHWSRLGAARVGERLGVMAPRAPAGGGAGPPPASRPALPPRDPGTPPAGS